MAIPPPPPPPANEANTASTYYPPPAFYFSVKVLTDRSERDTYFQEVSGINTKLTTEDLQEGGENRFKHKLPNPPDYGELVLKRGLLTSTQPLFTWCMDTIQGDFSKQIQTKAIKVSLLGVGPSGDLGESLKEWDFVNAWPISWELSPLNSQENKITVETLKFSYNYFSVTK